jgi:uncharacterized delta-60 repeat protein
MRALLALALCCLAPTVALAQEGMLDATFNGGLGYRLLSYTSSPIEDSRATASALGPDDSIFVAGQINGAAGAPGSMAITRLTSAGYPDGSFGGTGTVFFGAPGGYNFVSAMAVQPDGKLLASIYDYGQAGGLLLQRFNADGSPDATFGPGGVRVVTFPLLPGATLANAGFRLQPDGKILVGGTAQTAVGSVLAVVRLLPSGATDPGFGTAGQVYLTRFSETQDHLPDQVLGSLQVLPSGSILLVGATDLVHGTAVPPAPAPVIKASIALARLGANGALDATFGDGGVAVYDLGITGVGGGYGGESLPNGKFYVGAGPYILRFNANGTPDLGFGGLGLIAMPSCFDPLTTFQLSCGLGFALQSDGKFVLGGTAYNGQDPYYSVAARLKADGQPDPTFGNPAHGVGIIMLRASAAGNGLNWESSGGPLLQGNRVVLVGRAMWSPNGLYYKPIVYRLGADALLVDGFE